MLKTDHLDDLKESMAKKSDSELNEYLTEFHKYTASELSMAIAELKNRGKVFNDTEWQALLSKVRLKLWAEDPDTPAYYTPVIILRLSFFFSVLFGAILFSTNLKNLGEKYVVVGFGLTFLLLQFTLARIFPSYLLLHISVHIIGCAMLYLLFCKKYIGTIPYLRKSADLPVLVGVMLLAGVLYVISFAMGHRQTSLFYDIGLLIGKLFS